MKLAEQQHGVFSRTQARAAGINRAATAHRIQVGAWEVLSSKVLRVAGSPETFEQRCMAAVLDGGPAAVVSHESAAALWGLPGFGTGRIELSREKGRSTRQTRLATLHLPRWLPEGHVTVLHGIPVTTVARTIFDLAGTVHPKRAERALDNALARALMTLPGLRTLTTELAERGRPGSAVMCELLAARPNDHVAPESGLESRFLDLLREAGLPWPERQRNLGGHEWVGRVDFLYPDKNLVIELDGSLHHSSALDRAADERRDNELREAGYQVCRIRADEVWRRPGRVVATVRTVVGIAA